MEALLIRLNRLKEQLKEDYPDKEHKLSLTVYNLDGRVYGDILYNGTVIAHAHAMSLEGVVNKLQMMSVLDGVYNA